jgi:hypothetical protein
MAANWLARNVARPCPSQVLRMGYGFKMVGVDAVPNAAQVVQLKAIGNRAAHHLVDHPMCLRRTALDNASAVSFYADRVIPLPAFGLAVDAKRDAGTGQAGIMPVDEAPPRAGVRGRGNRLTATTITQNFDIVGVRHSDLLTGRGVAVAGGVCSAARPFCVPRLYHSGGTNGC